MGAGAILELFAKLSLDSKEFDEGTDKAKGKFEKLSSFVGKAGKTAAVAFGAAFTAASTATIAMGKAALDSYSQYEQLSGGIQKLFGEDAANTVFSYAEKAFLTSGKSMNEYMSSVSQISASLKRSIGDDLNEVARVADIAMQAISDNVNTFGSDAEFVENAIMGLSRNNYTMIDNLKLGYAGSAEGMRQLINDSGVLGYELKSTADLANVGFDKMVLAIQAVQEQQGIAGTTAKEALTTIEGAGKATTAAWQNVLTSIARGEGIQESLKGLSDAIFGVGLIDGKETGLLNQIIPRIQKIMEGIGEFIAQAAPYLIEKIPQLITSLVPTILSASSQMLNSVASALPGMFTAIRDLVMNQGVSLVGGFTEGFTEGFPEFLENGLSSINSFIENIRDDAGSIIDVGMTMIENLFQGIVSGLPTLLGYIPQIVGNMVSLLIENAPRMLEGAMNLMLSLLQGLVQSIPNIVSGIFSMVGSMVSALFSINWLDLGGKILTFLGEGIKALLSLPIELIKSLGTNIFNTFKNIKWGELGKNLINGIVNGIKSIGSKIGETLMDFATGAFNKVKDFFGISSPSKLMRDEIGRWIPEGVAEGIRQNEDSVFNAMADMPDIASSGFNSGSYSFEGGSSENNLGTVVSLLQQIANNGLNVTLEGDASQMFKVVRKQAINFEKAKGYSAI